MERSAPPLTQEGSALRVRSGLLSDERCHPELAGRGWTSTRTASSASQRDLAGFHVGRCSASGLEPESIERGARDRRHELARWQLECYLRHQLPCANQADLARQSIASGQKGHLLAPQRAWRHRGRQRMTVQGQLLPECFRDFGSVEAECQATYGGLA